MILLDSGTRNAQNFFAAGQTVEISLPEDPAEHKVYLRVEMTFQNVASRTLHVLASNTGITRYYTEFYVEIDNTNLEAGDVVHFQIGPLLIDVSDTLAIQVQSDDSGDTNESMEVFCFSDDLEYYLSWLEAELDPTADSIAQRITAIDDVSGAGGDGDLAAAKTMTTAIKAVTDVSIYTATVDLSIDETNSKDEYTAQWFKDGVPLAAGITSPKIQVAKRADGTDLIANTAMTEIVAGAYKYDATTTERSTAGEAVLAIVTATIDAATRTWKVPLSRDSTE